MRKPEKVLMDVIAVGGCANGSLLRKVEAGASKIALRRPEYIKPVSSVLEKQPNVVHEQDTYDVHPIELTNDDGGAHLFGLAVVEGRTLTWGFSQLVKSHVLHATSELTASGMLKGH